MTAETTWAEGTYIDGRYLPQSEILTCPRCGHQRMGRPGRATTPECRDCRPQIAADDKAWLMFHPSPRMSAEDRRWAERAAVVGMRLQWERVNRRGGDELLQRRIDLSTHAESFSTPQVDRTVVRNTSHRESA